MTISMSRRGVDDDVDPDYNPEEDFERRKRPVRTASTTTTTAKKQKHAAISDNNSDSSEYNSSEEESDSTERKGRFHFSPSKGRKCRGGGRAPGVCKIAQESKTILLMWYNTHQNNPFPTLAEKQELAQQASLDVKQVCHWFLNQRKRFWHPQQRANRDAAARVEQFLQQQQQQLMAIPALASSDFVWPLMPSRDDASDGTDSTATAKTEK